jgi:hypothetical protein
MSPTVKKFKNVPFGADVIGEAVERRNGKTESIQEFCMISIIWVEFVTVGELCHLANLVLLLAVNLKFP